MVATLVQLKSFMRATRDGLSDVSDGIIRPKVEYLLRLCKAGEEAVGDIWKGEDNIYDVYMKQSQY